jgi:hypothetical protein
MRDSSNYFNDSESIYISYKIEWQGNLLQDEFIWPRKNREVHSMKEFALHFITEKLHANLNDYQPEQLESNIHTIISLAFSS